MRLDDLNLNQLEKLGLIVAIPCVFIIVLGLKMTGGEDNDRSAIGAGVAAVAFVGLLFSLLVFAVGRMKR